MKKKVFLFFTLALAALLCFAVPAIAGPPEGPAAFLAMSQAAAPLAADVVQELAPSVGVEAPQVLASNFGNGLETAIISLLIATVATLAYLMSGASITDAQAKYVRRSRGFANGNAGGRRWV